MSKLPQLNLRIPEQHQQLIRDIAHILRQDHGDAFAADLFQWLNGRPAPGQSDGALAHRILELEAENTELRDGLKEIEADAAKMFATVNEQMDDYRDRLAALEEWKAAQIGGPTKENPFTQEPGPAVSEWPGDARNLVGEDVLEAAAEMKAQGATWEYIAQRLGQPNGNSIRNAVTRWRKKLNAEKLAEIGRAVSQ